MTPKDKDLTPQEIREGIIYPRNIRKYGDPLGPTIEYLRAAGKTWDEIAEGACRAGGTDIKDAVRQQAGAGKKDE